MKLRFSLSTQIYLICLFLTLVAVILSTIYIFWIKKDYYYRVEAPCDPTEDTCFYRDCSEEGSCYDYEEEVYKVYRLRAEDFRQCISNSCQVKCSSGAIKCEEITCDPESDEDQCYEEPSSEEADDSSEEGNGDTESTE